MKGVILVAAVLVTGCGPVNIPAKSSEPGPAPAQQRQGATIGGSIVRCENVDLGTFNGQCVDQKGSVHEVRSDGNTGPVAIS